MNPLPDLHICDDVTYGVKRSSASIWIDDDDWDGQPAVTSPVMRMGRPDFKMKLFSGDPYEWNKRFATRDG